VRDEVAWEGVWLVGKDDPSSRPSTLLDLCIQAGFLGTFGLPFEQLLLIKRTEESLCALVVARDN
jgi:hypothetical protein